MRSRGKYARRTGQGNFQSRVKKAVLRTAETKYYDVAEENVNLYHNIGYSSTLPVAGANPGSMSQFFNPWSDIPQGTGRNNRIGDKIYPRGMSIKLWLANKLDRPNVMYRVIVLRCPKSVENTIVTYNNRYPFELATLGSTGNAMLLPLDKDRGFKAYYDKVINNNTGYSARISGSFLGAESHKMVRLWIKSKKGANTIVFGQSNSGIVNNPLLLYVIPYDSYGTLISDNIASCSYYMRMYYKDV